MRSKVTLILLFLNVALFFFIFRFERDSRLDNAAHGAGHRIFGAEAADIRSIEVAGPTPASSYNLEKRGDAWFLTKPIEWPANANAVNRILNDIQFLEHDTSFNTKDLEKNGQSLADYGLEQPKLSLTFTSGEAGPTNAVRTTILKIGDTTKVGDRLYLLSPDGEVIHVVNRSLLDGLSVPFDQLRSDTILTIPVFEARSLSLQTGSPSGVRVRLHRDGSRWTFETPVIARGSKSAVELAINGIDSLRLKSFPASPPAPLPSSPAMQITIEGNNRRETLFIGGPVGDDDDHYAQLDDRPAIFTVAIPDSLMQALKNAPDVLRDRHVLDFDPNSVTAITLAEPNQPDLVLQRLEAPAGGDHAGWETVRRVGNAQSPLTAPADGPAVKRLLEQLELLSAERFQSDAPSAADLEDWGFNRPERTVTLTVAGSTSPIILQIGLPTRRGNLAYARIAGSASVYAIDTDILQETLVSPLAWRDRLLRELPESAKVTSLTLTRIAGNSVVYSKKLGDGDTWESALASETAARRSAVQAILDQLRSLHSRRFVQDGWSEKVPVDGEQRPWQYKLEATMALPGGAGGVQSGSFSLWLMDRSGGAEQLAGAPELACVFEIEQPMVDALWTLTYGNRDPGPPAAAETPKLVKP